MYLESKMRLREREDCVVTVLLGNSEQLMAVRILKTNC